MTGLRNFVLILYLLLSASAFAGSSMFDRRTNSGESLYQALLRQQIPNEALDLIFRMFDYNQGRIPNTTTAVIVDYSQISTVKRLYLLHFDTGQVERFYVAHGIRSGVLESRSFSNQVDSWKSSLGFYFAKGSYNSSKNGLSLYLEGIDKSNNNARTRLIVMHGAKYVSDDFIFKNGRLGWSQGCFAVGVEALPYLLNTLQGGSILLSYHKDLMWYSRRYPDDQSVVGEEIIPPGVNRNLTPGEGGDGN